jgi:phosphoadenosine phosphosulfate reductase
MIAEPMPTAVVEQQSVRDLDALNAMFEDKSDPQTIVDWAAAMFGPQDIVMSSSFGAESAMLLHMATRVVPDIKIIFVDTGYLFPETHQFMEQLRRRFNLNVWTYRTMQEPISWLAKNNEPDPTVRQNRDVCCAVNKNEPFERAMAELRPKAWLRGVRRDQTDERKAIRFVQWDRRFKCYAVSPLLNQNRRQIHAYLKQHDLPYHPLFDRGYASIGCNPLSCTRPIQIGEDARAGRWAGSDKIECGINVDKNSLDSAQI